MITLDKSHVLTDEKYELNESSIIGVRTDASGEKSLILCDGSVLQLTKSGYDLVLTKMEA